MSLLLSQTVKASSHVTGKPIAASFRLRWTVASFIFCATLCIRPFVRCTPVETVTALDIYIHRVTVTNFFIRRSVPASCSGRHDVGQVHVNTVVLVDLALALKLFLNLPIQFYLNNVTNLHQLTLHSTRHIDVIDVQHYLGKMAKKRSTATETVPDISQGSAAT